MPKQNAQEAAITNNLDVYGVTNIKEVIDFFDQDKPLPKTEFDIQKEFEQKIDRFSSDFSEVKRTGNGEKSFRNSCCRRT